MNVPRSDDGASLILVLIIVTVMGLATLAVAEMALVGSRAAKAISANERLLNALDTAVAVEIEKRRSAATACPSETRIPDVDGSTPAITVHVGCRPADDALDLTAIDLTATGYLLQPVECAPPAAGGPTAASPRLDVRVTMSSVGTSAERIAKIASRHLTSVPSCTREAP